MSGVSNKQGQSWKEKMIKQWDVLCSAYRRLSQSPNFKRLMKVIWELIKILLPIVLQYLWDTLF